MWNLSNCALLLIFALLAPWTNSCGGTPQPESAENGCSNGAMLAIGPDHTCVLLSSSVYETVSAATPPYIKCWGFNSNGAMGYGDTLIRGKSEEDMGLNLPFINLDSEASNSSDVLRAIVTGNLGSCYLYSRSDSSGIRCWGQLGPDADSRIGDEPGEMGARVPFRESGALRSVSIGETIGCFVEDNAVYCWGNDNDGFLLNVADSAEFESSVEVQLNDFFRIRDVVVGFQHACVYDSVNIYCWGCARCKEQDRRSILGKVAKDTTLVSPSTNFYSDSEIIKVVLGDSHTCILYGSGDVICSGINDSGQLGLFGQVAGSAVDLGSDLEVLDISAGGNSTCVLLRDGQGFVGVKCWGVNDEGQLGTGDTNDRGLDASDAGDRLPFVQGIRRNPDALLTGSSIHVGRKHACLLLGGDVFCWGSQDNGALGTGSTESVGGSESVELLKPANFSCFYIEEGDGDSPGGSDTAPPTTAPTTQPHDNVAMIVGASVGAFVLVLASAFLLYVRRRHRGRGSKRDDFELPIAQVMQIAKYDGSTRELNWLRDAEQRLVADGHPPPFDLSRVVPDLVEMGISLASITQAMQDLRDTIAIMFSERDSKAVRRARVNDLTSKMLEYNEKEHRYAVFISHSQQENEWARLMTRSIESHLDGEVFCDLDAGLENLNSLGDLMTESANLVMLLSEKSVASPWCVLEVILARQRGVKMLPIILEQFDYSRLSSTVKLLRTL